MARSVSRSTRYYTTQTVQYVWPTQQLLGWRFVMYATGGTLIGVFAAFLIAQQQLDLGIPWIFPYGITVGALTIIFLFVMEAMITQRTLLPGLVLLGAFILLVLYLAGLIETALQLFGSGSNVNGNCQTFVINQPSSGVSLATFAFLQQRSICQSWQAVFAFWIVGVVFLIWLMFLASQSFESTSRESRSIRETEYYGAEVEEGNAHMVRERGRSGTNAHTWRA